MEYKIFFRNVDVTNSDKLEGGSLFGLDELRKRLEQDLPKLFEKQLMAKHFLKEYPDAQSLKMGTLWTADSAIDILFVPKEDENGSTGVLENYKLTALMVSPDLISFESTPFVPMFVQIIAKTDLEKAMIKMKEQKNQLNLYLRDAMRDKDTEAAPFQVRVETDADCVVIGLINEAGDLVGEVELENHKGIPKVYIWETEDVCDEPTQIIEPKFDFSVNLSEQVQQNQKDVTEPSDRKINRLQREA